MPVVAIIGEIFVQGSNDVIVALVYSLYSIVSLCIVTLVLLVTLIYRARIWNPCSNPL